MIDMDPLADERSLVRRNRFVFCIHICNHTAQMFLKQIHLNSESLDTTRLARPAAPLLPSTRHPYSSEPPRPGQIAWWKKVWFPQWCPEDLQVSSAVQLAKIEI